MYACIRLHVVYSICELFDQLFGRLLHAWVELHMFMQSSMTACLDDCSMHLLNCICLSSLIDFLHDCSMHKFNVCMYACICMYTSAYVAFYNRLFGRS